MGKKFVAGISYADNVANVAVLEISRGNITVDHLEEHKNGKSGELWFLERLLENPKQFRKVSEVSVALDAKSVLQHTFPMDVTLTPAERGEQVEWELANLMQGFEPGERINDIHEISTRPEDRYMEMYIASARRSLLNQMQRALEAQKYELHLVDTNLFAGHYALLVNYPETRRMRIMLASVGMHRVDAGALSDGRFAGSRHFLGTNGEELASHLLEYCTQATTTDLYLYGHGCNFSFLKALEAQGKVTITKVNPFRRLEVSPLVRKGGSMIGQEHKYVASVGVALRKE